MNSRKQESGGGGDTNNSKILSRTTPSRQSWAGFNNPRIVRASRSLGGKDRHSKVCTVKGLRDRRIRLSVSNAIELYDLQDRLGLSQPSKVVDWLIDATKHDIDKLPHLQMPPPSLSHFFNMKDHQDYFDATLREPGFGKDKWIVASHEQQNDTNILSSQSNSNYFQLGNHQSSKLPAGMLNSNMPFNNTYWEPNSNLSLCPFGNYHSFSSSQTDHQEGQQNSGSQLYFCPTLSSLVPPQLNSQLNHLHFLNSSSQHVHPNLNPIVPTLQLISSQVKSSISLDKGLKSQERTAHDKQLPHKEGSGS